jgi:hypothetical protein
MDIRTRSLVGVKGERPWDGLLMREDDDWKRSTVCVLNDLPVNSTHLEAKLGKRYKGGLR